MHLTRTRTGAPCAAASSAFLHHTCPRVFCLLNMENSLSGHLQIRMDEGQEARLACERGRSPVTSSVRRSPQDPDLSNPCCRETVFLSLHREQHPSPSSRTSSHHHQQHAERALPVPMAATPPALGVSTAILDAVVFCNQDESLWPMSEHCSGVSTKLLQQRHPEI